MKATKNREIGVKYRLLALAAACAACQTALAQQADPVMASVETAALAARSESLPRIEVTRSAFPRLEGLDSGTSGPRLDLTVIPPRRSFGLALGMSGFQPQMPLAGQPTPSLNFDVGLTWRHTTDSNYQVDFTAWRRVPSQPDAMTLVQQRQMPTYMARVELNLSGGNRSGLVADKGFLGVQLENGARISLKRKDGGAMVYYRKKF
ncbi:hypothetical protein [Ramlibacter albus]|uniref:Uncharacterized protein n=1 Tax=Ramlibacter albus TaxID=2079448 RepID=A0A923MC45_9BURK|nr:hypothetical protein [Ramlibacter albus]MBC5766604.1 hypothetical protein [Ramlibacter albus]